MHPLRLFLGLVLTSFALHAAPAVPPAVGVPVTFELPADGPLPKTYLVTLAIADPKAPDWLISTFVAGQPRTVTKENGGRFTETWNGLDDNFMPVPPGNYAVKGIYSVASQWPVDNEWHAITPRFAGAATSWQPPADDWTKPLPFGGDPVNAPLRDIAVGPNGVAVFYYQYMENGLQLPMFDLNKPVKYDQFLRAFKSGGAGGGPVVATDGDSVWAFSTDGGPKYVYRADQKSFGDSPGANRRNSYLPAGWVTDITAWRDTTAAKSFVYVAQRGRINSAPGKKHIGFSESIDDLVNEVTVHDGDNGNILARIPIDRPLCLTAKADRLYVLHPEGDGFAISYVALKAGLPEGAWQRVFTVPATITPFDFDVDGRGRFYISHPKANKVYQLDAGGKILRTYGRLDGQKSGTYDRETFMQPSKLATWTGTDGKVRLLVVEYAGPNRVSEWGADDGTLLREFLTHQTKCNNGYAIDPANPSHIYLPGHADWLTRFKVNYETREWTVDAVWPDVIGGQRKGLDKPVAIRANGQFYLASEQSLMIYRLAGDRWVRSAGLVQKDPKTYFFWHDANNNNTVDDDELTPTVMPSPGNVMTYHGQKWLADLSFVGAAQGGPNVWRLSPAGFDEHDNPIFKDWQKLIVDPIFTGRAAGTLPATRGGNELAQTFSSDWAQVDGTVTDGFYVQARGGTGPGTSANHGAQHKISRYIPDGAGGYRLKWRVGRTAIDRTAERGEIYGAMRIFKPINGLLTVVDQTRSGLLLYTEDGLYVDTIFPDGGTRGDFGIYRQGGEFFAGTMLPNSENGKIYYAAGKYTPIIFEMDNWTLKKNPVQPLTRLQKSVSISAAQIAPAHPIAVAMRGGAGKTSLALFSPALGGVELDGSLTGWESTEPVTFSATKEKTVEVRCLYDPETLYLRWHVRLGSAVEPKPLPPGPERLFTHDQGADTVSFYLQGNPDAAPGGPASGRPGDVRFIFGLFKQKDTVIPVGVGFYPSWSRTPASPQVYRTPVGEASFAHVGSIPGVKLGHVIDSDGKGFVIAAAIPRSAVPAMKLPFSGGLSTLVNFDANLGGHEKFWWADSDGSASRETYDEPSEARFYPGSWASARFIGISDGVVVRNWMVLGPFGGPGAEKFTYNPSNKDEVRRFYDAATYPPDGGVVDLTASYDGAQVQGYWKNTGQIKWKPATVEELDTRVVVGSGSQVWYGVTWIYAPATTDLELVFQSHLMTYLRWTVNGREMEIPFKDYKRNPPPLSLCAASRMVTLQAGWNQVNYRGYCVGYAPFRVGLALKAAPEKLWPLRFSGKPPAK